MLSIQKCFNAHIPRGALLHHHADCVQAASASLIDFCQLLQQFHTAACSCQAAVPCRQHQQHSQLANAVTSLKAFTSTSSSSSSSSSSSRSNAGSSSSTQHGGVTSSSTLPKEQGQAAPFYPVQTAADSFHRSLDKKEAAKFAALADKWWDVSTGPFAPLHALNAARCLFVRQGVCSLRGLEQSLGEPLQGLQVLDVGCGGGLLSEPVARMGADVVGIDVSDEGVAAAAAHAAADPLTAERIRYLKTTLEELLLQPGEAGRYDVVMSSEVIEHVRRPQSFMADLAAAAAPGGQVFITTLNRTPAAFALAVVGAEYLMNLVPRGTHNWDKFITPQELAMMGTDAGLKLQLLSGMVLDPWSGRFRLDGQDVRVNYAALFSKPT